MATPPTATDWYIVIPVRGNPDPSGFYGSAQSFIVNTDDMDVAAQVAHDHGFARAVVVLGTHYHDPTVPDPPPYTP
jgi:hypothetical protein